MQVYRRELLKGITEMIALSVLSCEAMYGHQLLREMEQRSSGYFRLKKGTLYPSLHRLTKLDLIGGNWQESSSGSCAVTIL